MKEKAQFFADQIRIKKVCHRMMNDTLYILVILPLWKNKNWNIPQLLQDCWKNDWNAIQFGMPSWELIQTINTTVMAKTFRNIIYILSCLWSWHIKISYFIHQHPSFFFLPSYKRYYPCPHDQQESGVSVSKSGLNSGTTDWSPSIYIF